eukprot:3501639-Rhodomonas_salina.5
MLRDSVPGMGGSERGLTLSESIRHSGKAMEEQEGRIRNLQLTADVRVSLVSRSLSSTSAHAFPLAALHTPITPTDFDLSRFALDSSYHTSFGPRK